MNTFSEYSNTELFHGYEADFSVKFLISKIANEGDFYSKIYPTGDYIEIKKDYFAQEYKFLDSGELQHSTRMPWISGGISVTENENGITEVTVKIIDPGIPNDNNTDIEFPFLYPGICTRIKGIFSIFYLNNFEDVPPREYRGFLKGMKPTFPKGSYPTAEYTFQCSGFEMTRTVRTFAYPSLGTVRSAAEEAQSKSVQAGNPDVPKKTFDRSWAVRSANDSDPFITNKKIIQNILESYNYKVEWRKTIPEIYYCLDHRVEEIKTRLGHTNVEPAIKAEPITDWLFIKGLLEKPEAVLLFEPRKVNDKIETLAVIDNKSNSTGAITEKGMEFHFNRMNSGNKIPFNPLLSKKFVMLDEPSIEISGNWQASNVAPYTEDIFEEKEEKDTEGNVIKKKVKVGEMMKMSGVDEDGNPILYELDMRKLENDANGEASYTFKKVLEGKVSFETVKHFFIATPAAPKYPEGGKGYKVYQFHGIEASFQTLGNPFAQINMVYPILGLGKYYSIGVDSTGGLSEDVNEKQKQQEEEDAKEKQKLADAKKAQANSAAATPAQSNQTDTIKTPSGVDPGTRKPKLTGLRLKSLTHNIDQGKWTTSYNFGM